MKFIPSRDLRIRPGAVWRDLKKEGQIVVTSNGQPVAVMVPVTGASLEETLRNTRGARLMDALRQIQEESVRNGTDKMTMEEIDEIIREARQEAKKGLPK